jgi:hypothetical protein
MITEIFEAENILKMFGDALGILGTGSRFICPEGEFNDIDIMLYVDDTEEFMKNHTLEPTSCSYGDDLLVACRQGKFNILVTEEEGYFLKWKFATEIAKGLKLAKKEARIFLFSQIIDNQFINIPGNGNFPF